MRENIRKKMKSKEGFTLAELLIVVAIIAILAMISIPIFTSRMEEAKRQTDAANVRSAKAAAVSQYLSDSKTDSQTYFYNADKGSVVNTTTKPTDITGYGQLDGTGDDDHKDKVIKVVIGAEGASVTITWE